MELVQAQNLEMQEHMSRDVSQIKRENQDYRGKIKLQNEIKTKMEMELMNVRVDLTRAENEVGKMSDWCKEMEVKIKIAEDNLNKSHVELEFNRNEIIRLNNKVNELDDTLLKKQLIIDKSNKDMVKFEKDQFAEIRRIKLQLKSAETEILGNFFSI